MGIRRGGFETRPLVWHFAQAAQIKDRKREFERLDDAVIEKSRIS
jgi:hypothetical protein